MIITTKTLLVELSTHVNLVIHLVEFVIIILHLAKPVMLDIGYLKLHVVTHAQQIILKIILLGHAYFARFGVYNWI